MNAPLPEHIRKALETVTLDDKYSLDYGRAFMTGMQALVRLPMAQRPARPAPRKNTAGFISGYRGSPLGGYDQQLWPRGKFLEAERRQIPARRQRRSRSHRDLGHPAAQSLARRRI
jgi:indolepyruvate ferredoxin oxidoreductase